MGSREPFWSDVGILTHLQYVSDVDIECGEECSPILWMSCAQMQILYNMIYTRTSTRSRPVQKANATTAEYTAMMSCSTVSVSFGLQPRQHLRDQQDAT